MKPKRCFEKKDKQSRKGLEWDCFCTGSLPPFNSSQCCCRIHTALCTAPLLWYGLGSPVHEQGGWVFLFTLLFEKLLNSDLDLEASPTKLSNTPYEHQHKPAGLGREQVGTPRATMLCLHLYPSFTNIKESVCTCARKPAKRCSETLKTTHINRDCHASLGPCLNSLCMLVSVTLSPPPPPFFSRRGEEREQGLSRKSTRAPHSDFIIFILTQQYL